MNLSFKAKAIILWLLLYFIQLISSELQARVSTKAVFEARKRGNCRICLRHGNEAHLRWRTPRTEVFVHCKYDFVSFFVIAFSLFQQQLAYFYCVLLQ